MISALLLISLTHWVHVKDGYRVHERLLNKYGGLIGEYYEVQPSDFVAVCYGKEPHDKATEESARTYVLGCEAWQ
jgi:hypothetical protein